MVQRQNCDDNLHQCTGTEVCKNQHAVLDQNGEILIKRSIHAILSAMKTKLNKKVDPNHSMLAWIARHAAFRLQGSG